MHEVGAFIWIVANHFSTWQISVPVDPTFWGTVFRPGSVMWLMDGRNIKNKSGFLEPVHQTCIQDCTLFSCDLRTLGTGRHHLFKCHYAYICLLKYSNLFQGSKCFNRSELWMLSWEADLSVMTPTFSPWSICFSLRVIFQEQKALQKYEHEWYKGKLTNFLGNMTQSATQTQNWNKTFHLKRLR